MASDFTYEGEQNNQYSFREKASGQNFFLMAGPPGATPELLDGDEVALPNPNSSHEVFIYSLRQQRQVRTEFR